MDTVITDKPNINKIEIITSEAGNTHIHGDQLEIEVEVNITYPLKGGGFAIQIFNRFEVPVVHFWIFDSSVEIFRIPGKNKLKCIIPKCRLFMGEYTLTAYLSDANGRNMIQMIEKVCPFSVEMFKSDRDHPWQDGSSTYLDDFSWVKN